MTGRLLAVALFAMPCALGAHLAAVLLFAAAVVVAGARLLPVLVPVAIIGTAVVLLGLVTVTAWRTGFGVAPVWRTA